MLKSQKILTENCPEQLCGKNSNTFIDKFIKTIIVKLLYKIFDMLDVSLRTFLSLFQRLFVIVIVSAFFFTPLVAQNAYEEIDLLQDPNNPEIFDSIGADEAPKKIDPPDPGTEDINLLQSPSKLDDNADALFDELKDELQNQQPAEKDDLSPVEDLEVSESIQSSVVVTEDLDTAAGSKYSYLLNEGLQVKVN